ncbi:MAG: DUF5668 domain-containing protein [Patescibacteria group bacterium]
MIVSWYNADEKYLIIKLMPMFLSYLLIILGLVFLFKNLGWISGGAWGVIWPLIIIIFGVAMLSKKRRNCWHWPWCDNRDNHNQTQ